MSNKIQEIYYRELNEKECSLEEAAQYYYFYNLLGNIDFKEYEDYETKQIKLRNSIIRDAKQNKEINEVNLDSSMLAISSLKNKVILISETM